MDHEAIVARHESRRLYGKPKNPNKWDWANTGDNVGEPNPFTADY